MGYSQWMEITWCFLLLGYHHGESHNKQYMARLPVEACHGAQGDRVGTSGQIPLGTVGYIPMSSPVLKMVEPLFFLISRFH
jgi:hypothetical protein